MASRSTSGGTVLASGIRTRERKERKLYSDDWALGDEEIEGHHTFNLDEKVKTDKFDLNFVKDMTDTEFSLAYMQKNGFNWPLLFRTTNKLGIVVPNSNFSINDVRLCVGSRRMLDVMDVNTQKNVEMTMKDWQRYYESQDKDKLLNVISLEFSHTKLETLVEAPTVVRQIDWVEKVWPRHLKEAQTESTNVLEDMMYPKVQKYCLMSVSGCYTDFHIDFGGTSVWYHILKGKKIFWLIPPSERNLQLYEQWVLSGKQGDIFFGDTVEKCARIELNTGNTFFIPTGWIHAVYTPEDSLVFGGNFLHSFGIEKQLRVAHVEDTTHVPQKFRYPFFTEMLWYLLERYVHVLLDRSHLTLPPEESYKYERARCKEDPAKANRHLHLTQYELHGMKAIVMFLHSLPTSKKFVPELIKDPIALIRDVRTVVEQHRYDSPELAVTNKPVMDWWERESVKYTVKRSVCDSAIYVKKQRKQSGGDETKASSLLKLPPNVAKVRHRRIRCKECEPCTRGDCQQCVFCKDMIKYGGGGTMKQTCKLKKCSQPVLPATACCYICHLDGWMRPVTGLPVKVPVGGGQSSLMECIICFKISHPECLETKFKGIKCIVNEDLPNSWECADCIQMGYNKEYKHNRAPSSRISSGSDTNVKSPLSDREDTKPLIKTEAADGDEAPVLQEEKMATEEKPNAQPGLAQEKTIGSEPVILRMPTWEQLQARVSYPLVRPSWVIRPAPPPPPPDKTDEDEDDGEEGSVSEGEGKATSRGKTPPPPCLKKEVILRIFAKLSRQDLLVAMRVCRQWAEWSIEPSLWKSISLTHRTLDTACLNGVVRRQPSLLRLDWSEISYDQFSWLLCRLPQLQRLHCEGLSWGVIRPLLSPYCPPLSELNLSFCESVDDDTLSALLRPPLFNRPGFRDAATRLHQLIRLGLAGTQVGDSSVSLIARSLPFLTHLDLSGCLRLTDQAPELLAHSTSVVSHSLTNLDLRGCHRMSPMVLPSLAQLPLLSSLALHPCDRIPLKAIKVWGQSHLYSSGEDHVMTRVPPVKDPLSIEGVSDCEAEAAAAAASAPPSSRERAKKSKKKDPLQEDKVQDKENLTEDDTSNKNGAQSKTPNVSKADKGQSKPENTNKKAAATDVKKVLKERDLKPLKRAAPTLKCVLTPLEKTLKAHRLARSGEPSKKSEKKETEAKDAKDKKPSPAEAKGEEDEDEEEEEEEEEKPSEQKPPSDSACRRSERSNKGRKYKLNFAKRKAAVKERLNQRGRDEKLKGEEATMGKKHGKASLKSPGFKKKHLKKTLGGDFKRKSKKNIVTRSKKQREGETEVNKAKQEYEVVQRRDRPSKESSKGVVKEGQTQGLKGTQNEDLLKVRIALKVGPQYASKLRKKASEDQQQQQQGSCPSSSPETKRSVITPSSSLSKEEPKPPKRLEDASTSAAAAAAPPKKKDSQEEALPFVKKRKERKGSSSSSSSSSTSSSSPCLPLSKKLKVELEPISKLVRRRSDSQKTVLLGGNTSSGDSVSSGKTGSASTERSSSRERPERHHRSPRRLSMSQ